MNDTKDKKLATELDSVISDIKSEETPLDDKKKKLWDPEVVTMLDEENLTIGDRTYRLVHNHRDGFNAEKLGERFSEVLCRYDYVVGDWGYDQLRLKGFFNASHKKAQTEQKIDTIEDYLYEYCNFGCAFFVLERVGGNHDKRDNYKEYDEGENFKPRRKRKRNSRPKNKAYIDEKVEKVPNKNKPAQKQKPVFKKRENQNNNSNKTENKPRNNNGEKKRNFTIRQKGE